MLNMFEHSHLLLHTCPCLHVLCFCLPLRWMRRCECWWRRGCAPQTSFRSSFSSGKSFTACWNLEHLCRAAARAVSARCMHSNAPVRGHLLVRCSAAFSNLRMLPLAAVPSTNLLPALRAPTCHLVLRTCSTCAPSQVCRLAAVPFRILTCRPRLRDLEACNAELSGQLASLERQCATDLQALTAEHELLRRQCGRWEGEVRRLCLLTEEPLPPGLELPVGRA